MKTSTISESQSLPSCQRIMKTSTISESQSLPSLTLYNHARMTTAAESSSLLPSDGDVNSCEDDPNCVEFAKLYSVGDVKSIVNLLVSVNTECNEDTYSVTGHVLERKTADMPFLSR